MCFVCLKARGKVPKKKAAGWARGGGGPFFSKTREKRASKTLKKQLFSLTHSLISFFSRRGVVRFIILHQTREDIRNTHTHTHTHTHALKTRKESLSKTIVIRKEDVSREEE